MTFVGFKNCLLINFSQSTHSLSTVQSEAGNMDYEKRYNVLINSTNQSLRLVLNAVTYIRQELSYISVIIKQLVNNNLAH